MLRKLTLIMLGVLIGLCVSVFRGDIRDFAWAAVTHYDRLVLGTGNFGTDPNTTADITMQYDEYITNATDGTLGFGAADLVTTGAFTLGESAHKKYTALVSIPAADVKKLNATPYELVADPGDDFAVIFLNAVILYDWLTPKYGDIAGDDDLIISYTDGSGEKVAEIETTGFLDEEADALRYCTPSTGADGADNAYIIPVPSAALVISLENGEITGGNSVLDIAITYKVIPTNL